MPEHGAAAVIGAVSRPIERGVARLFGRAAQDADRVAFSEVGARTVGLVQGTRDGLVAFAKALRTGDSVDPVTKLEGQQFKAIPGLAGEIIRVPTRLLTAEDELFKGMARRMELTGLAMRRARAEGLKGSAASQRAQELLSNPTDEMAEKAQDYARYLTFQAPLGGFMRHISAAANESRAFRFLVPFIRTPTNLLKFAIERSPAAPILKEWRKDVAAGGARRDLAAARALVGSGIGAMVYEAAARGEITGGGPADENAKRVMMANGWQPYSFKVGDRYYSYRRLDPVATTIGTVADMVDLGSQMTDKQREKSATLISAAIMNNLASKTWLTGVSGLAEALSDPDRHMQDFVSRSVGGIATPAIVAQIARTTDPILREAREPLARIRSRVPGLSDDLMPRRDVFGQPVTSEGGVGPDIVSPIWTGTDKRDPVAVALLSSGIGLTIPKRTTKTERLSDADFNRYQALAGQKTHAQLAEVIRTPDWKGADKSERGDMVDKIVKRAREEARDEVLQPAGDNWWEAGTLVQ